MYKFSVRSKEPSNAIRSPQFPVLEAGNTSFPNGEYIIECELGDDRYSLRITHHIKGVPLISRLLDENKAMYVCTVSSPISSYRSTYKSKIKEHLIRLRKEDLGEPPLITPMIVSTARDYNLHLNGEKDGVNQIWHDQVIDLKKGSRLALGSLIRLRASSIIHFLKLDPDKNLKFGEFYVAAETEGDFRFRVHLHPDLHSFLQKKGNERSHIMTNIVTACLSLLQRDFGNDSDDGEYCHRSLEILADYLRSKDLPHWNADGFRPEQVATKLYPHKTQDQSDNG